MERIEVNNKIYLMEGPHFYSCTVDDDKNVLYQLVVEKMGNYQIRLETYDLEDEYNTMNVVIPKEDLFYDSFLRVLNKEKELNIKNEDNSLTISKKYESILLTFNSNKETSIYQVQDEEVVKELLKQLEKPFQKDKVCKEEVYRKRYIVTYHSGAVD